MIEETAVRLHNMSPVDIPLGMRWKEGAGWNQVPSDWQAYLALEPAGCFVAELGGRAVGTATALPYQQRFGWIGMILVDPDARRRGIATQLMHRAITYLESAGCACQKLDATETGARVYEKIGFTVEYEVQRWIGRGPDRRGATGAHAGAPVPLSAAHWETLAPLDDAAFGASRRRLLQWYGANPAPRFLAGDPRQPAGYVVGRPGSRAWQMGPLVAENGGAAEQLMAHFLSRLPEEPVIADVVAHNRDAVGLLERFGFTRQRVLQRMYRGPNDWPGRPHQTFCLAGFEFG